MDRRHTAARRGGLLALALALSLSVLPAPDAAATATLELLGAAGSRHPFTARVLPTGAAAAWFNPALLPGTPRLVELHVTTLVPRLAIDLAARPAGVDVPPSVYRARAVADGGSERLALRPLPTERLRRARGSAGGGGTGVYLGLGAATSLLDGRLALAAYGLVPLAPFQAHRPFFVDEREQYFSNSLHFELFEDRTEMASFAFAVAGRPLPWLRLGAGLTLYTATTAETEVYYPDATEREGALVTSTTTIRFRVTPHFALGVQPVGPLLVTATVHLENRTAVDGATDVQFWTYPYPESEDSIRHPFGFAFGFLPLRVGVGASWTDPADGGEGGSDLGWAAAASVVWSRWSTYRDRNAERPAAAWSDTVTIAVGSDLTVGAHRVGLDLTWVPSPVPAQRGRSNYVDNDRIGVAVGWDLALPVGDLALDVGIHLQVQALLDRDVTKAADAAVPVLDELRAAVDAVTGEPIAGSAGLQTNNPGYPGFRSGGWLLATGASLRLRY